MVFYSIHFKVKYGESRNRRMAYEERKWDGVQFSTTTLANIYPTQGFWRLILTNVTDEKRFSVLKMVLQNSFGELVCLFSLSIVDCSAPLTTVHFNVTNVIRCSVFKMV